MMRELFYLLAIAAPHCLAAQDAPVLDETIKPVVFADLAYPLAARLKHVHGLVVVRVTLDEVGKVVRAVAISGARELLPDCVSNAEKWRFRPNAEKVAVIVYQFQIAGLCNLPCRSQFRFEPPNLVVITMGEAVVDHAGQ